MAEEKKVVLAVSAVMFFMLSLTLLVLHGGGNGITGFVVSAQSLNYSSFLAAGLFILIISAASVSLSASREKKKLSGQLGELVKRIKKSLIAGDLGGAVNGYKVLNEQFSYYQDKIPRKDVGAIYKESLELYAEIVRLQARLGKKHGLHMQHSQHRHKSI